MHQDGSYADYLVPAEMVTCWVALDDTRPRAAPSNTPAARTAGRGSRPTAAPSTLPTTGSRRVRAAAPEGEDPEVVPVVVRAGGCSLHHSLTFHGSGPNQATTHRRAIVSHLLPAHARFHPTNVDQTYSRYRCWGDLSMDESFFPVVWDATGGRTPWLRTSRSCLSPCLREGEQCPRKRGHACEGVAVGPHRPVVGPLHAPGGQLRLQVGAGLAPGGIA